MIRFLSIAVILSFLFSANLSARQLVYESGGVLIQEQASYDVTFYELDLKINPADSTIGGTVFIHADIIHATNEIVVDLDPRLSISSVYRTDTGNHDKLKFTQRDGTKRVHIWFGTTLQPGENFTIGIDYGGKPLVAPNPPWNGGFVWSRTPSGEPWVGVACQTIGAWVWWPNKDHPTDKADSVSIKLTMPDDLVVASNGHFRGSEQAGDGWKKWHWFVSTPINNYNVTVNAAPYEVLSETYISTAGDEMDITFWVLPEYLEQGKALFPQFAQQLRFLEEILGPYPFRADKYGVAHAPYLGMEHQTIIAYGSSFQNDNMFGRNAGFDDLHQHELAHEWWGNAVTAWDWRDFWIHEGFGTYMQPLYAEHLKGKEGYHDMMALLRQRIRGGLEIAPRQNQTTVEVYGTGRGGDIYYKGAWFLHTLRYYMGDDRFFESLRRFVYPDPAMEAVTDGSQLRFATTDDYLNLVNSITGEDLGWMFEVYLRNPGIPQLNVKRDGNFVRITWKTHNDAHFPMPLDLRIGDQKLNIIPENGAISFELSDGVDFEIDPDIWVLKNVVVEEPAQ
jgi:aminopeptidase N